MARDKKSKQQSKAAGTGEAGVRLVDHPRARRHIQAARAWGGLAGFVLAGLAAQRAGLETFDVGLRALAGGVIGLVLLWAVTLVVWRQLAVAELRAAIARVEAEARMLEDVTALTEGAEA